MGKAEGMGSEEGGVKVEGEGFCCWCFKYVFWECIILCVCVGLCFFSVLYLCVYAGAMTASCLHTITELRNMVIQPLKTIQITHSIFLYPGEDSNHPW